MRISVDDVQKQSAKVRALESGLGALAKHSGPIISNGFSQVVGVSEAGGIHGRAVQMDPASASETLGKLQEQVNWLSETLGTHSEAYGRQESDNSRAMDLADVGGTVEMAAMPVVDQPEPGYSPFSFTEPVVSVGTDLDLLAAQLNGSDIQSGAATAQRWRDLAEKVTEISDQLDSVADGLVSSNDSEATERAASKIREVALTGKQFAANSRVMAQKVVTLGEGVALAGFDAMLKSLKVKAIKDPIARKAAEMAALSELQTKLQTTVARSMPMQASLISDYAATGGGDIDTGVGDIAGRGERYTTDGVQWPKELVQKAMNGTLGPGDFGAVKQAAQALSGINDDAALNQAAHSMVQGTQSTLPNAADLHPTGDAAGAGTGLNLPATNLGTQSASALDVAPHPGAAGTVPGGTATGATGGSLNGAGMGPGGALAGGLPAAGGKGNGFGMSQLSGIGQRSAADMRTQASGLGTLGARPFGGPHSMNGVSGLGGPSMLGGRRGAGALGAGAGAGAGAGSAGGLAAGAVPGGGVGSGAGVGAGAAGGRAGGMSAGPGMGAGAGPAGSAATSGAGAGRGGASAGGRGMMPMMGARGGDSAKSKKVKSVVTQVELEPNKKALLGEPPLVVPGVIGAWVRD